MRTYTAVFLASLASLGYEILLIRVFSIVLWHHFAFMVVSIAMLGLAASGTAVSVLWAVRRRKPSLRPEYFLLLGLTMVLSYLAAVRVPFDPVRLSWDPMQLARIALTYLILSVPFFLFGTILASAFASMGEKAGLIYACDLSGAALGVIIMLAVQNWFSPGQAVFLCAAFALAGSLATGGRRLRLLSALLLGAFLLPLLEAPSFVGAKMSPYKELPSLLRMGGARSIATLFGSGGRADLFRSPGVRHAPGLSLKFRGTLPEQIGLALDGGGVTAVTVDPGAADREFLGYLPSSLAFELRPKGDTLLIDPRGGVSLLLADRGSANRVDCTESNPVLRRLLLREAPGSVEGCVDGLADGLARNLLSRPGSPRYHLIDLPLSGALPGSHIGGSEDYRLTVEAFESYLSALDDDGLLNISLLLNTPYRSELRLFTTLLEALERIGAEDPSRHVVALRSVEILCLIVRRSAFEEVEIGHIEKFARLRWFDTVYLAGRPREIGEEAFIRTRGEDLPAAYATIAAPHLRDRFIASYLFDIAPPTDDRPYFHDHLKLSTFGEVFELVEGKWDFFILEGYLLPLILLQVTVLGLSLVVAPALLAERRQREEKGWTLAYFAFLGMGYMFVEVGLLQRLILPLEHPSTALAVVLGTILTASGLGSFAARRWKPNRLRKVCLAISGLTLFALLGGPSFIGLIIAFPLPLRAALICAALFPAGFLMGMPFPGGLRHLADRREKMIPWAWGVNGFFSVLSPILAVICAVKAGYSFVLALAALSYLGAAWSGRSLCASPTIGTKRTPPS